MASLAPTSDALKDLASQIRKNSDARVQTFESRTFDVANEKMGDARYIGDFRPNQNRLNVFSMISKDDADDYYRFQMKSPGKLHLALLADQLDKQRKVTAYELPDALRGGRERRHIALERARAQVELQFVRGAFLDVDAPITAIDEHHTTVGLLSRVHRQFQRALKKTPEPGAS